MKKILTISALLGAGVLLLAAPLPKINWCHFPPGQYPNKVLILNIDTNGISGHDGHQGDGPEDADVTYKGVTYKALGAGCGGSCGSTPDGTPLHVNLTVDPTGNCDVCPDNSKAFPTSGGTLFCSGSGG